MISRKELTDKLKPGAMVRIFKLSLIPVVDPLRCTGWHLRWKCCCLRCRRCGRRGDERGEDFGECCSSVRGPISPPPDSMPLIPSPLFRSEELFACLEALRSNETVAPCVVDIRGKGLMVAVEFATPTGTGPWDAFVKPGAPKSLASRVAKRCQEKGLMILTTSVYEVIRFIPALNITKEDLAKGCKIFAEAVEEVVREG